ncbi:MAG TPA: hypothetical protein VGH87_09655 [Polyangiaceae bacterium]
MQTACKWLLVLAAIVTPGVARADVDAFGDPLPSVNRTLFALTLPVPIAFATRAGPNGGAATTLLGAIEARSYFGHQGFLIATGFIDSPRSAFADVAWSFADFSSRRMRGFHGGVSFDAGPSIAYVSANYVATNAQNAPTASPVLDVASHAAIGARVSAHVDLFIGPFMLGLVLGYRGGVPTNASSKDSFEGIFFFNAEVGAGFVR